MAGDDQKDFWVKVHHSSTGEVVLAVCDGHLLGKVINVRDGFSVTVEEKFYGGQRLAWGQVINLVESATIINFLGNEAVEAAIGAGIVPENAVMEIGGIKHIQVMR